MQLWTRVELGVVAIKGFFAFPKIPVLLNFRHPIVYTRQQISQTAGAVEYTDSTFAEE